MEEKKPEDQPRVEKETAPPPAPEPVKDSQKPASVKPEPEAKKEKTSPPAAEPVKESHKPSPEKPGPELTKARSKVAEYLRTGLIWLGVIVVAFLAGILVYHFARFRPVSTSLAQASQSLEGLQARSDELTDQLETANRRISTLDSDIETLNGEIEAAEIHIVLLQALSEINTANIALANQDVAGAKVALANTANRFETLKPSIASVDSALAENISQRLDLINTNMENDPETAMADLGLLARNLLNVETLLFGE